MQTVTCCRCMLSHIRIDFTKPLVTMRLLSKAMFTFIPVPLSTQALWCIVCRRLASSVHTLQIGPNVSIGRNVTVGAGARIRESIILDDANVGEHACVLHAIIGWKCVVGKKVLL